MIKKNKISLVLILATTALSAYAQVPSEKSATTTTVVQSSPTVTAIPPSTGNVYEKEVTPLLRDVSKKKSILELRKLDRELEKIDEEALKSKSEREKLSSPATMPGLMSSSVPFNPPVTFPAPQAKPTTAVSNEIRIVMIYGYDTNLFAKVAMGTQGGYVVKAGDILPDGRKVLSISPNFVEVIKSKSGKEKIFVSGPVIPEAPGVTPQVTQGTPTGMMQPGMIPPGMIPPGMMQPSAMPPGALPPGMIPPGAPPGVMPQGTPYMPPK